jgi:dihydrofolate reductase
MRKVVANLFVSLDGVVEAPEPWQFEFDDDMAADMTEQLAAQDAVLLGRVTYQEWADYWPTATDEPFASHINTTPCSGRASSSAWSWSTPSGPAPA